MNDIIPGWVAKLRPRRSFVQARQRNSSFTPSEPFHLWTKDGSQNRPFGLCFLIKKLTFRNTTVHVFHGGVFWRALGSLRLMLVLFLISFCTLLALFWHSFGTLLQVLGKFAGLSWVPRHFITNASFIFPSSLRSPIFPPSDPLTRSTFAPLVHSSTRPTDTKTTCILDIWTLCTYIPIHVFRGRRVGRSTLTPPPSGVQAC